MNDKDLNSLDGDAVYQEVLADKVEKNRRAYKQALKNALIRNDNAQASVKKVTERAETAQTALNDLINGGMAGFLATEEEDDDEDESGGYVRPKPYTKRPYSRASTRSSSTL